MTADAAETGRVLSAQADAWGVMERTDPSATVIARR